MSYESILCFVFQWCAIFALTFDVLSQRRRILHLEHRCYDLERNKLDIFP